MYSGPIEITKNGAVVHAMSTHAKLDDSPVAASEPFEVQTTPPVFSPEGGIGVGSLKITISTQEGDHAFCTMDGSKPTASSTRCDGTLEIKRNDIFVRAIAVRDGLADSPVAVSELFTLHAHPPHCDPNGGSYEHMVQVSLQYPGEGFYQILYSKDGSIPWPDPSVVKETPSGDSGQEDEPNAPPDEPIIPPPQSLVGGLLNSYCANLRSKAGKLNITGGKYRRLLMQCMDQDCEQSMESGGPGAGCRFLDSNGFCLASAEVLCP